MAVALQHRGPSYFLNPNPSSGGGGESGSGGVGGKKLDLEMIYEEEDGCELIEEDHGHSSGSTNSYPGGGVGFGGRGLLFKQRSRSLPQEEFIYLTQKLRELDLIQRTDSIISGQSARTRDSGFNSEIPSCACGILASSEHPSQQGLDLPSALLASDLNSGFLAQYGLDGPLDVYPDDGDEEEEEGAGDEGEAPEEELLGMPPAPSATSTTTKRKKREEMKQATIRQHYYPEGGWGFVVLTVAVLVQIISHGLQLSFGIFSLAIIRRWDESDTLAVASLGALSMSLGLFLSPIIVGICKRKSTRLTAVIGGLVLSLGCLFSSFANQFHQLYFSHAVMTGLGVGLTRDTSTLMVAQYFKRKREIVEMFLVAASGLGISIMSTFLYKATSTVGWRLGLQQITGLLVTTFLLGTFYRSASLYHPQRRAILHLKTQKRKIKNKDKEKNKLQDDRPPFFEFTTLKSRTVRIILFSALVSHVGIYSPLFFLASQASLEENITKDSIVQLQVYIGLAWAIGTLAFGLLLLSQSSECRIARQYLTQASLIMTGLSIFSVTAVRGSYSGYVIFAWIYGIFNGGFHYSLKMYIYEKVRARNFARAWSFTQMAMGLALILGLPLAAFISKYDSNVGYYISASCVVFGSLSLSCIDLHKKRLRKKRRLRQCKSTASTATAATSTTFNSTTGTIHHHLFGTNSQTIETPKHSFMADMPSSPGTPAAAVVVPMVKEVSIAEAVAASVEEAVSSGTRPKIYLVRSHSDADVDSPKALKHKKLQRLMSLEMMEQGDIIQELDEEMIMEEEMEEEVDEEEEEEDMEEDLMFNDEMVDYLEMEGITSCNKVENCVILSEFEQNCIKENDEFPSGSRRMRDPNTKKWFVKSSKNDRMLSNHHHRGKKWNQVLPGPSKEMATVIEESSNSTTG